MAVIDQCSFDWFGTAQQASFWNGTDFSGGSGIRVVTSAPLLVMRGAHTQVWGGNCNSGEWTFRNIAGAPTSLTFVFAFFTTSTFGNSGQGENLLELHVTNNPNHDTVAPIRVYFPSNSGTQVMDVTANVNGVDIGTAPGITRLAWHVLEFQAEIGPNANIIGRVDGVEFANWTGDTSGLGAGFGAYGLDLLVAGGGFGPTTFFTDLVVNDNATGEMVGIIGTSDPVVTGYLMDVDGPTLEWTPNSGSVHFDRINQVPPDDDTSYLTDGGAGTVDLWGYTAALASPRSILAARWIGRTKRTSGTPFFWPVYHIGGVNYHGSIMSPGASYAYLSDLRDVSPVTGEQWSIAEINAMDVGANAFAGAVDIRLTEVAWEVASIGGPGPISSASTVTVSSATVLVGASIAVTLEGRDINGTPLTTGGATVVFGTSGGESAGEFGPVQDNGDGTYTAVFRAVFAGSATTITATVNGLSVTTGLPTVRVLVAPVAQGGRNNSMVSQLQRSDHSRLWLIEGQAGPGSTKKYESFAKAGSPTWSFGDVTNVYVPDPGAYGQFDVAGVIIGERGNPQLPVTSRYMAEIVSDFLKLGAGGCPVDLQVHMGLCKDPRDFNGGWNKILVLEGARITQWGTSDLGALMPSERSTVDEDVAFTGQNMYEIMPIAFQEQAAAQIVQEVIGIIICDAAQCGDCGIPSDGCQVVFAVTLSAGGSPGLSAEVIFTSDGGGTWDDTNVTTLAANQDPTGIACVSPYVVVISEDSVSLHYALAADILAGTETWEETAVGFGVGGPRAIWSADPAHTWMVGAGGFIYFASDVTAGVEQQDAGVVTTQDLNAVHGIDIDNIVAVGNSNSIVATNNGGQTWFAVTGPSALVGVDLQSVWMRSQNEWMIGADGGLLYYTRDAGDSWTQKAFPGYGAGGAVKDIKFSSPTVGYMAHASATPRGRILRTIDGGASWYVAPENNGAIPNNDRIDALAVCANDVNLVYGAGLGDNAIDGFICLGA